MCGISGIICWKSGSLDRSDLERLSSSVVHRGPDSCGIEVFEQVGLAHRRLSIIDLSDAGAQPMSYRGRFWITYNGEIYNYIELRKELQAIGHVFASKTDTEVILAAWAEWGPSSLKRFNGMWAFALYDSIEQSVYLARDRFGEKPLYYKHNEQGLCFGSEIRQMLSNNCCNRINEARLLDYLILNFEAHTSDTMFKGVSTVRGGSYLSISLRNQTIKSVRYYNLGEQQWNGPESELHDDSALKELLTNSVRIRMRSDVPVGVCLSGGLDSSAIAAVLGGQGISGDGVIRCLHAKSLDAEVDESSYAQIVAASAGLELTVVEPSTQEFLESVDDVVRTQEEPFGSPSMFMGWHLYRVARQLGCKVMLSGQGADEMLLGYERYCALFLHARKPLTLPYEIVRQSSRTSIPIAKLIGYYIYFNNPSVRRAVLRSRSLVKKELSTEHDFSWLFREAILYKDARSLQISELTETQLPHLLRYEDRNSMAHSVEARLPFLDHRIVEYCVSCSLNEHIQKGWTKYRLRRAFASSLPENIVWRRRKIGFEAPERSWLSGGRQRMLAEIRDSELLQRIVNTERLLQRFDKMALRERWKYYNVAVWARLFRATL